MSLTRLNKQTKAIALTYFNKLSNTMFVNTGANQFQIIAFFPQYNSLSYAGILYLDSNEIKHMKSKILYVS
jgi:hypothetical protein